MLDPISVVANPDVLPEQGTAEYVAMLNDSQRERHRAYILSWRRVRAAEGDPVEIWQGPEGKQILLLRHIHRPGT